MPNGGDKGDKILHGIRLTPGEIRDLREESNRRHEEFREFMRKSDARFEVLIEKMEEDRRRSDRRFDAQGKEFRRGQRIVPGVARDIRKSLDAIHKTLRTQGNGKTNGKVRRLLSPYLLSSSRGTS